MAENDWNLDDLKKDFLLCGRCSQLFGGDARKPQLLPCLHTVCSGCLTEIVQDEAVECPVCRSQHPVPDNQTDIFSKDHSRKELLHYYLVRKCPKKIHCDQCHDPGDKSPSEAAGFRCKECPEFLCEACKKAHKRYRGTKNHTVCPAADLREAGLEQFASIEDCPVPGHEQNKMTLFCEKCDKVVCIHCTVTEHTGHSIEDIHKGKVHEDAKKETNAKLGNLEVLLDHTTRLKSELEKLVKTLPTVEQNMKRDIDRFIQQCIAELLERGNTLKGEAEGICSRKWKVLSNQLNQVTNQEKAMSESIRVVKQSLLHNNPGNFLQIRNTILNRLGQLLQDIEEDYPHENDIITLQDGALEDFHRLTSGLGCISTTSVFPPKTKVSKCTPSEPGHQPIFTVRLCNYKGEEEATEDVALDVTITAPDGERIEADIKQEGGQVVVSTKITQRGSYNARLSVLNTGVWEGSIELPEDSDKDQTPVHGTKAYLDFLSIEEVKNRYTRCPSCKTGDNQGKLLVLPCLHSLCDQCANSRVRNFLLTCPTCEATHNVDDVTKLPEDPLRELVEEYLAIRDSNHVIPCNSNECHMAATVRCMQCAIFLCIECSRNRQRFGSCKGHDSHPLQALRDRTSTVELSKTPMCRLHSDEKLSMYCTSHSCDVLICTQCGLSGHTHHDIEPGLHEVYLEKENTLKKQLEELSSFENEIAQVSRDVQQEYETAEEDLASTLGKIDDIFKSWQKAWDSKQTEAKTIAASYTKHAQDKLSKQLQDLKDAKKMIEDTKRLARDQLGYNGRAAFLQIQKLVGQRLQTLLELELPYARCPYQRSSLRVLTENKPMAEESLEMVEDLWTPELCPWKTRLEHQADVFAGQETLVFTVYLVSFEEEASNEKYQDGVVDVEVFDPEGAAVDVRMSGRDGTMGLVDVYIQPNKPGPFGYRVQVLGTVVPSGEGSFQVRLYAICSVCDNKLANQDPLPCGHVVCEECQANLCSLKKLCPTCGHIFGDVIGNQPPCGVMTVRPSTAIAHLPGYDDNGVLEIIYRFKGGQQGPCHPHPGQSYGGCMHVAYLPDNEEGQHLSILLRVAFERKLVCTVGELGGADNVVLADIPHKTNALPNTINGYPDAMYLERLQRHLASQGVTRADIEFDSISSDCLFN